MVKEFYKEYKEIIIYIVVGVAVSIVNWGTYFILTYYFKLGINWSNVISWIIAVLFAYILNKEFVFRSREWRIQGVIKELVAFVFARIFSGFVDIGSVPLLMKMGLKQNLWVFEGGWAKFVASIISTILNYVISKWIVFNPQKKHNIRIR